MKAERNIVYMPRAFPDYCTICGKPLKRGDPAVRFTEVSSTLYPKRGLLTSRKHSFVHMECQVKQLKERRKPMKTT